MVAIIGRPNTGKSTLFNSMLRRRIAIVSDIPGTTRDHIAGKIEGDECDYLLLDTGGMGGGTTDKDFEADVHAQSLLAIESADLILFTLNGKEDLTKSDREIAQILRKAHRKHAPIILVLTKCDNKKVEENALVTSAELGIGDETIAVSALNNQGTSDVEELIERLLKKMHFSKQEKRDAAAIPRVAVIGKPNVGKSSLINALMSDTQRTNSPRLVSDVPGTTRDITDTTIRREGEEFIFVDTAGLKKRGHKAEEIEFFAYVRTLRAIEDADVVVLVLDASQPPSKQDKHIAGLADEAGKALILLLNKSDLLPAGDREQRLEEFRDAFLFCRYAPVLLCSALTREKLPKIFDLISMVHRNRHRRLPTRELQRWLRDAVGDKPLGELLTTKFITQGKDPPPTFILFVKHPKQVRVSQLRYLGNRIREVFEFSGTPIRWITKGPRDKTLD